MPIRVLPPQVAAKIAAGEVIERPASVAKELLENAIDAGADDIRVEIAKGGRQLIQVSDNGCGIPADEIELAFMRHATSKLQSADELYRIQTLGFRGEALASIAAVSRLTLSTRTAREPSGTVVRIEGGEVAQRSRQPRPMGTVVRVENLFFNTPARLRFLRTDPTEASHISRLVTSYALAYPDKRFTLEHNGRRQLHTIGSGDLLDVIAALDGLDVADQMIAVSGESEESGIHVSGYVGGPSLHRRTRRGVVLFVNRRWIEDSTLTYAVREAYRTLIPQGRYPRGVLLINLPPEDVDVNIHPTKREVRFRHERQVFAVLQRAVRRALIDQHPVQAYSSSSISTPTWDRQKPAWQVTDQDQLGLNRVPPGEDPRTGAPVGQPVAQLPNQPQLTSQRLPMLRVLGQIASSYIVAEGPGGLYLIDQHAAHERIRYEQVRAQAAQTNLATQELLQPLTVDLPPQHATLLEAHLEALRAFGFEIAPFGGTTFIIHRIPATLTGANLAQALGELLDEATEGGQAYDWNEGAQITVSCHTAIRAGQTLSLAEMQEMVRQLEQCEMPHSCPHGRPTMLHMSRAQLELQFGRG